MKLLTVVLGGALLAMPAALCSGASHAEEKACPAEANQIIYDAKRTLDTKNTQSVQSGWQYSNAVIERCSENFYALIPSAEILYLISSWASLEDGFLAASKGWEAISLASGLQIPEEVPQVKRPDGQLVAMSAAGLLNPAIENLAKNLVLFSGNQSPLAFPKKYTHGIFNPIANPVEECPYAIEGQSGASAEANGLLKGAIESGRRFSEFMATGYKNANTRLDVLQRVCPTQSRYIAEIRAELSLKFGDNYAARPNPGAADLGNALGQYQTARNLLDASYEMTSEGRPYRTIEKLHNEINEKLERIKAAIAEAQK